MAKSLSFTDLGKLCTSCKFLTLQICLNAIREKKILAKISKFTVHEQDSLFLQEMIGQFFLVGSMPNVPVNSYGHLGTVHTFFPGQA